MIAWGETHTTNYSQIDRYALNCSSHKRENLVSDFVIPLCRLRFCWLLFVDWILAVLFSVAHSFHRVRLFAKEKILTDLPIHTLIEGLYINEYDVVVCTCSPRIDGIRLPKFAIKESSIWIDNCQRKRLISLRIIPLSFGRDISWKQNFKTSWVRDSATKEELHQRT